jgi:hypothetical protein
MNGDRRFSFIEAFTHVVKLFKAEVKLMKSVYESYGWSYLINTYYDSYDEMYEIIEQMKRLPNPRFPYAIVLIRTLVHMDESDNIFRGEWGGLQKDMVDTLREYDRERYDERAFCESLFYDDITQQVYEKLDDDLHGEYDLQRRIQTYYENFTDIKWTRLVNECTEAKPIGHPQKLIRLGNDIAMK